MASWRWRRAVAGLGMLGLLSFTAAGDALADPAAGGRASPAAQPGPTANPPPGGPRALPEPSHQPAPEFSPAGATSRAQSRAQSSPRPDLYTGDGIPRVALRAYRNAADLMGDADPSCHLHWSLLAAIGRVESDHGRHGGSSLYRSGETTYPIIGPALDGSGNTARILDSDGGDLDGDARFDRAVGPMQFLPGTWRLAGQDGDGDGQSDPTNIFDAALSAGRYLCAGTADLSDPQGLRDAVYRYNHSASYVDLVLSIAKGYREGDTDPTLPSGPEDVTPPEPLEPESPEGELPPATSGEPPSTLEGGGDETTPPDGEPPNGETSSSDDSPPGGNPTPPSDDDSEPPPSNGPTGPPDEESPSPPDDGSPPSNGGSPPGSEEPAAPDVSDVEPSKGAAGTKVTITGSGLEDADVDFGGEQANVLENDSDELVVEAPAYPEAGAVQLTVRGEDGESAKVAEGYTYVPAIDEIQPAKGSTEGGDTVELTGTSLADADVEFGGTEVDSPNSESSPGTELRVTTPAADEAGPVDVTASHDGQTSEPAEFTYYDVSAEPSSGVAGQAHEEVTLTAGYTEFAEEPDVTWSDDAGNGGALDSQEWSETKVTVSLPEHGPGAIDLTVARPEAEDLSTTFTYYGPDVEALKPQPVAPGEPATLHGSGIDGDSSVVIAGREEEIRVQEDESGNVTFQVPEGLEPGHHELTVTTSGVSSEPYEFEVSDDG